MYSGLLGRQQLIRLRLLDNARPVCVVANAQDETVQCFAGRLS